MYSKGDIIELKRLTDDLSVPCQGGIRFSKKNNLIALFLHSSSPYSNSIEKNKLEFMGSGKGNQSVDSRFNKRLFNAQRDNTDIFVFKSVDTFNCEYLGQVVVDKEPTISKVKGLDNEIEKKVIFHLKFI
jgi:hypothetical protein